MDGKLLWNTVIKHFDLGALGSLNYKEKILFLFDSYLKDFKDRLNGYVTKTPDIKLKTFSRGT